jgi:hypothetical protein
MSNADETARVARVEHEGRALELDAADVRLIEDRARGMAGIRRSVAYLRARYKYPAVSATVAGELAGAALGWTGAELRSMLAGSGNALLHAGEVMVEGRTWKVEPNELEELDYALAHGSWRVADLYPKMKARTGSIEAGLALTALLLETTVESVRGSLAWHDQYIRWHDGDPDYSIL